MQTETYMDEPAETATEKLYDLCMIEQLCRGNREQVKEMMGVFIEEMPQAVEDIWSGYEKNDFALIKNVAHRIKPILSYYAIVKIEKDILQVEALAVKGVATAEFENRINKVETVITLIVKQMKEFLLY